MLIVDLIGKRERIDIFSSYGWSCIAKRMLTFHKLISLVIRELKFVAAGASIGKLVVFESIDIQGTLSKLSIGSGSFIGKGCVITTHDLVSVGKNVVINSGVNIFTASHDVDCPMWSVKFAPVIIEDFVWIASGATILPGSKLCRGAVIGAGAIICGVVESGSVVVGNPAKKIKTRGTVDFLYSPSKFSAVIQAWVGSN